MSSNGRYQANISDALHSQAVWIDNLYAVLHVPKINLQPKAVLLAYPIGFEYERSHKALRQLAWQLAKRGYWVLRVDYQGTGDSAGDFADWSLAVAAANLQQAALYLHRTYQITNLTVIGVRLGANAVLQAFGTKNSPLMEPNLVTAAGISIQGVGLWSPVLNGQQLLQEWQRQQYGFEKPLGYVQPVASISQLQEVMGYPLSPAFKQRLLDYQLTELPTHLPVLGLSQTPFALAVTDWQVLADIDVWWQAADAAVVPAAALQALLDWIEWLN